jgi:hypothetical protein
MRLKMQGIASIRRPRGCIGLPRRRGGGWGARSCGRQSESLRAARSAPRRSRLRRAPHLFVAACQLMPAKRPPAIPENAPDPVVVVAMVMGEDADTERISGRSRTLEVAVMHTEMAPARSRRRRTSSPRDDWTARRVKAAEGPDIVGHAGEHLKRSAGSRTTNVVSLSFTRGGPGSGARGGVRVAGHRKCRAR